MKPHKEIPRVGSIIVTTRIYKNLHVDTKGWIYRIEVENGVPVFLAIFFFPNFSGSNRHYVTILP